MSHVNHAKVAANVAVAVPNGVMMRQPLRVAKQGFSIRTTTDLPCVPSALI